MKKFFLALMAVVALAGAVNAQNAIGLRFGYGAFGTGAEISYQMGMGANRLELDLGLNLGDHYNAFQLTGMYQWHFDITGGLGWYAGVGGAAAFWAWDNNYPHGDGSDFDIMLGGQLGLDFDIPSVPLQLSLDVRPLYSIIGDHGFGWGACFGIRYQL